MNRFEKVTVLLNGWLRWVAGAGLVAMMLLAGANMIARVPGYPIQGTYELTGFLASITAAFALGYTQIEKGHIKVDIVTSRLSPRAQLIIEAIMYFVSVILFALVTWQVARFAGNYWREGNLSETLKIIYFPFTYGVALGSAFITLVLILDLAKTLTQAVKK